MRDAYSGEIPRHYEAGLGPAIFEPCARDLAARATPAPGESILEIAAGTGRVTRHLSAQLPTSGNLIAIDLNPDMVEVALESLGTDRINWIVADAQVLPFKDDSFHKVFCQFGFMFFRDKSAAFSEVARVLKPGGTLVFNVWGGHQDNPWAKVVHETMLTLFPSETPGFMALPFTYHDEAVIREELAKAHFCEVTTQWLSLELTSPTARAFATGAISGNPLWLALRTKGVTDPEPCIDALASAFRERFGDKPMRAPMKALIVTARMPQ